MFTYNPILTLIILVIFGCEFRILPYTLNIPLIPLIPLNTLMEYSNDTYAYFLKFEIEKEKSNNSINARGHIS